MDDATIGGLCMDVGKASTSHRFGLFHETVVSYDIVTANGNLLHVTRDNYPDLFYTLPWSHGSLGILVAVELKVIPTKAYVHVNYLPCYEPNDLYLRMKQLTESEFPPDFVEGIVYSEKESVLMFSYFIDANIMTDWNKFNFINLFWRPWYHEHTKKALERGPFSEYIPIQHYHSRFSRSLLWEMQHLIPFSNQTWYRYCFGWLGAPKVSYLKKFMPPRIRKEIFLPTCLCKRYIISPRPCFGSKGPTSWMVQCLPLTTLPCSHLRPFPLWRLNKESCLFNKRNLTGNSIVPLVSLGSRGWWNKIDFGMRKKKWKSLRSISFMKMVINPYAVIVSWPDKEIRTMLNHAIYDKLREEYGCVGAFPWHSWKNQDSRNCIFTAKWLRNHILRFFVKVSCFYMFYKFFGCWEIHFVSLIQTFTNVVTSSCPEKLFFKTISPYGSFFFFLHEFFFLLKKNHIFLVSWMRIIKVQLIVLSSLHSVL